MERIMVATDFSVRSDRALRRATLLARQSGARLSIVHGLDDDRPARTVDRERREAEELLNALTSTLRDIDGVECTARVVLAEPSQAIMQAAQDECPDLLVIGPHRRQIFRDVFIGTTAERTIRAARCPVLMANAAPVGPYRHVVTATDLSENSRDAIVAYSRLELAVQARQSALHVFDALALRLGLSPPLPRDQRDDDIEKRREAAARALSVFLATADAASSQLILCPETNVVSVEILTAAEEAGADLIVVGTHGKRGLERFALGSVSAQILRDSTIDVLAIPIVQDVR